MVPSRARAALTIAVAVGLLTGCSSGREIMPADPITIKRWQSQSPPAAYLLQPGDVIAVKFYRTPQLNEDSLVIRPDGAVSLPYVGNVIVAGRTAADVEAELRERYKSELAAADNGESVVTVIVRQLNSHQVHVGGEVEKDGRVRLQGSLTALEAIQRAGGFLETADPERVVLIRQQPNGERIGYLLDLSAVIDGTAPEGDVMLQSADIVLVPPSTIADLNLLVKQYVRNMLPIEPGYAITP
ncbi:MAG TPA: polysaccharide biosynthesis/export family protein [Terriglobales bacterium]|nr:polysaccharide biosynthesis/export family protein [Terriglobales bacterium]